MSPIRKISHPARLLLALLCGLVLASSSFAATPNTLPMTDAFPNQAEANLAEVNSVLDPANEPLPSAVVDGDNGLSFCHTPKWTSSCLLGLFIYRCGQYTFPLTPYGCTAAAGSFMDLLELKRIDVVLEGNTYNLPVIFTQRLERMIQQPAIQNEMQSLRILLDHYGRNRRGFDLHEWFRAMSNGNHEKTLEKLAVLLQDTSPVQIHIHYLRQLAKTKRFSAATLKAIEDLEMVNYYLSYPTLEETQWKSWLKLYPQTKNIEADTTPLVYHFYPMAFLTYKLRGHGERLATFLPFLFNTEYLLQDLDPQSWPLHHPDPFKVNTDALRWKMKDMYGGLAGSLWGIRRIEKTPGLAAFQKSFSSNPYGTMRTLFWTLP